MPILDQMVEEQNTHVSKHLYQNMDLVDTILV